MIRLGLKLTLQSGRAARGRLLATMAGVALSTCLLLLVLAALNGLGNRDERRAWLDSGPENLAPSVDESSTDPLLWDLSFDSFGEQPIYRITLAALGPNAPLPPGMSNLPGPDEYYLSPALADLVRDTAPAELGDRFKGTQVGIVPDEALQTPDMLVAMQGVTAAELRPVPFVQEIRSFETDSPPYARAIQIMLAVGAIGLLFPIFVFIGTAARLAASTREQRFAALRLVGATPRQVNRLAAVEAVLAAGAGSVIGVLLYVVARHYASAISIFGGSFFPSDLAISWFILLLVATLIPAGSVLVSIRALRRVQVSPLGVRHQVSSSSPRVWRLVPLVAGFAVLAIPLGLAEGASLPDDLIALVVLGGFGLTALGIVLAGPWLTMIASRLLARFARGGATLIAARRMADNPTATFRSVSGRVLAVFVVSIFTGVATSIMQSREAGEPGGFPPDAFMITFLVDDQDVTLPSLAKLTQGLSDDPGVNAIVPLYVAPGIPELAQGLPRQSLVACADVPRLDLGSCTGTEQGYALVPAIRWFGGATLTPGQWDPIEANPDDVRGLPLQALMIRTNGEARVLERVRTTIVRLSPPGRGPVSYLDVNDIARPLILELQRLAYAGVAGSVFVAGCSLTVAMAAGILERKRAFSLLRLAGMPIRSLQMVVVLESTIPLIAASLLSAGLGLAVADLLLRILDGTTLHPPTAGYYGIVAISLTLALAILSTTLPLMRRVTSLDATRFE